MNAILAALLLLAPQEDDSKRAREAVLGLPGFEEKAPPAPATAPAPDQAPAAVESFMAPRVKRSADDYKELLDHNVFSPPRKKEPPKSDKSADGPKAPEGPKTRTWVLTGIVFNAVDNRFEALIEDTAAKEAKYFKTGDTIAGATISDITLDQVTVLKGGAPSVLKMKDSLTETLAPGASGPAKVEDPGELEKARERMKRRHKRESVPDEAEEDAGGKKKPK